MRLGPDVRGDIWKGGYAGGEEGMGCVTEETRAGFFGDPGWERVSVDEFPVYELAFGGLADYRRTDWIPLLDDLEYILYFSWERPRFVDVCFILQVKYRHGQELPCASTPMRYLCPL
jgi:hypothetical protein